MRIDWPRAHQSFDWDYLRSVTFDTFLVINAGKTSGAWWDVWHGLLRLCTLSISDFSDGINYSDKCNWVFQSGLYITGMAHDMMVV